MNIKAFLMAVAPPLSIYQNPQAQADAQGTWNDGPFNPPSLGTPAIKSFEAALAKYANQTTPPDQNEYNGWASASALIKGLEVAGQNPTQASFMSNLRKVSNFNGDGLVVSPVSFTTAFGTGAEGVGPYPQSCMAFEQYKGSQYVALPQPICGGLLPNSNAG